MATSVYGKGRRLTSLTMGGKTSVVGRQKMDLFLEERSQPPMVAANDDGSKWGAICINPNCEARVERGLKQLNVTLYRPTYTDWRQLPNGAGRQEVERNLMPPYAFVRFNEGQTNWLGVSQTDGVRGIVTGNDRVPIVIRSKDIATIAAAQLAGTHDQVKRRVSKAGAISAMPEVTFGAGQPVSISYGPWHGTAEVIEQITDGNVRVMMDFLGAMRVTTVPAEHLEAVG